MACGSPFLRVRDGLLGGHRERTSWIMAARNKYEESTLFDLWALDDGSVETNIQRVESDLAGENSVLEDDLAASPIVEVRRAQIIPTRDGWIAVPDDEVTVNDGHQERIVEDPQPVYSPVVVEPENQDEDLLDMAERAPGSHGNDRVYGRAGGVQSEGVRTRAHNVHIPENKLTARERVRQGVQAARLLHTLQVEGRKPNRNELDTLAGWTGWGATPELFDETDTKYVDERAELRELWDDRQWAQARRTILNAHYTHPQYVSAMWNAARSLGLTEGDVLEPGSGLGNFIAAAPNSVHMIGVELDSTTAEISRTLFPEATIRTESFADTPMLGDGVAGFIGNVPFSSIRPFDPQFNKAGHSMHNAFILKALRQTKPGGISVVLSSRYTLDATSSAARREIAEYGEFLGAVRLPAKAHMETAGTEVVTDVLMFRRYRSDDVREQEPLWLQTVKVGETEQGDAIRCNAWIAEHPESVIGDLELVSGPFGRTLTVSAEDTSAHVVAGELSNRLDRLVEIVPASKHLRIEGPVRDAPVADQSRVDGHLIGHLGVAADGAIWAQGIDGRQELKLPVKVAREVAQLVGLRDTAARLLDGEITGADDMALSDLREALNVKYDRYVSEYGPVSRYTEKAVKPKNADDDSAETVKKVFDRAIRVFKNDPDYAVVAALEVYDDSTGKAQKAAVFHHRVIGAVASDELETADTPDDALWLSLDQRGMVDVEFIAEARGISVEAARSELGERVFLDPEQDKLVTAEEYLSGNVRAKLKVATAAAEDDSALQVNVRRLGEVIPEPLGPAEISVTPGARWIKPAYVGQWIEHLTEANVKECALDPDGTWVWKMGKLPEVKVEELTARGDFNTYGPKKVLGKILNGEPLKMTYTTLDENGNKKSLPDPVGTESLKDIAERVNDNFQSCLWQDKERAEELAERYNDLFNGIKLREYDDRPRTMPGLVSGFTPRPHQIQAVNRMLFSQSAGLFHEVGAGKTAEMVMGCMEMKRLQMVNKPVIVVPNQLAEQFTREAKQLYPAAKILTASGDDMAVSADDTKNKRRVFVAKAAMGDWDLVIMTQSAFKRLDLGSKAEYMQQEVDEQRAMIEAMAKSSDRPIRGMEKLIASAEERIKKVMDHAVDPGLTFEHTGIDYLCVDEAHGYKNATVITSVEDLSRGIGSQKAEDLRAKMWYLRDKKGQSKVATFATATPIANSMNEMFVELRYLVPKVLEDAGLGKADDWARQFTEQEVVIEQDGLGGFRSKQRTNRFKNMPELMRMWLTAGDVKTSEDLHLPLPLLRTNSEGQRAAEIVAVEATMAQTGAVNDLAERAERVRNGNVDPSEDNILKIFHESRQWAMDPRTMDPDWEPELGETTKVDEVAKSIHQIWVDTSENVYKDELGGQAQIPGSLQIVFADRGTPNNTGTFSAYDALRDKLAELGVPRDQVAFIQEAKNDLAKAELFKKCRSGQVRVVIGSTEMMGTGTNIQARAVALHHLDCPWRPADITQREGRILRQGNQNPEIGIYRWVTKGSFDGFMWETVTRKAKFIEQVSAGRRLDVRELEDEDPMSHGFAAVAAIAADDMRIMQKAQLEMEIQRLVRQEKAYKRGLTAIDGSIDAAQQRKRNLSAEIEALDSAIGQANTTSETGHKMDWECGQWFNPSPGTSQSPVRRRQATLDDALGGIYEAIAKMADCSEMKRALTQSLESKDRDGWQPVYGVQNFRLDNYFVDVSARQGNMWRAVPAQQVRVQIKVGSSPYSAKAIAQTTFSLGGYLQGNMSEQQFVSRLSRALTTVPERKADAELELAKETDSIEALRTARAKPFPNSSTLESRRKELDTLVADMTAEATPEGTSPGDADITPAVTTDKFTPPTARAAATTPVPARPNRRDIFANGQTIGVRPQPGL